MSKIEVSNIFRINHEKRETGIIKSGHLINRRVLIEVTSSDKHPNSKIKAYRYGAGNNFYQEMIYTPSERQAIFWDVVNNGGTRITEGDEDYLYASDAVEFYEVYRYKKGTRNG